MSQDPKSKNPTNPLPDAEQNETSVARRALWQGGLVGLTSLLVQACSADFGTGFSSGMLGRKQGDKLSGNGIPAKGGTDANDGEEIVLDAGGDGGGDSGNDSGGDGALDPDFGTGKDLDDCRASNTQKLDVSNHPDPPSDLVPAVKFYGNKASSSMIAFQFTTTQDVESITLLMDSGQIIAFQRLTGADKDGANYRAIQIDNLFLAKTANVKFLIKSGSNNYVHTQAIEYFTTFNNQPVLDYSAHSIPAGYAMTNQSVTQFDGAPEAFDSDDSVTYPAADGTPGARSLLTATSDTTWTQGAGVKGIVTDIMGNTIDLGGKNITKYQTFCTYVDNNAGAYCRTIMKIG